MKLAISLLALFGAACTVGAAGEITRVWLSHQGATPEKLTVNWEAGEAAESVVEFGPTAQLGQEVRGESGGHLHHMEIPLSSPLYYRVRTGAAASAVHRVAGYEPEVLRVAVVADTGYTKAAWGDAVLAAKPHLLLSAGDHVPALHEGKPVEPGRTAAFSQLVARWPALFRTTPWLAALGNHDREIRPRGPKPPAEPVYDVEATAFRDFFALPAPEWHWSFGPSGFRRALPRARSEPSQ